MDGSTWLILVLVGLGALVLYAIRTARKAGPRTLSQAELARCEVVRRVEASTAAAEGWDHLGRDTVARGLDLRFDHDDDPRARAVLLHPDAKEKVTSRTARSVKVTLAPEFETHHAHNAGWVFRMSLRGTEGSVGKVVEMNMWTTGGRPWGGSLDNDDDDDCPVGEWIEVEWAEILRAPEGR